MKKKFFAVALALVLLAGAVAVGVHVLNKEARADVIYVLNLWEDVGGVPTGVTGAVVWFSFDVGDQQGWLNFQANEAGNGIYKVAVPDNIAPDIERYVIVIPVSFVPIDPDENPHRVDDPEVHFVSWEVDA